MPWRLGNLCVELFSYLLQLSWCLSLRFLAVFMLLRPLTRVHATALEKWLSILSWLCPRFSSGPCICPRAHGCLHARRAGLRQLKEERVKKYEYCLPCKTLSGRPSGTVFSRPWLPRLCFVESCLRSVAPQTLTLEVVVPWPLPYQLNVA